MYTYLHFFYISNECALVYACKAKRGVDGAFGVAALFPLKSFGFLLVLGLFVAAEGFGQLFIIVTLIVLDEVIELFDVFKFATGTDTSIVFYSELTDVIESLRQLLIHLPPLHLLQLLPARPTTAAAETAEARDHHEAKYSQEDVLEQLTEVQRACRHARLDQPYTLRRPIECGVV